MLLLICSSGPSRLRTKRRSGHRAVAPGGAWRRTGNPKPVRVVRAAGHRPATRPDLFGVAADRSRFKGRFANSRNGVRTIGRSQVPRQYLRPSPVPFRSPAGSSQMTMRSGWSFAERDRTGIPPPAGAEFPRTRHRGLVERLPFRIWAAGAMRRARSAKEGSQATPSPTCRSPTRRTGSSAIGLDDRRAEQRFGGVVMGRTRRGCRAAIMRSDAPFLPISRERSSPLPEGVMTTGQQGTSARAPAEADRGG